MVERESYGLAEWVQFPIEHKLVRPRSTGTFSKYIPGSTILTIARLAQLVERKTFNLVVVGSSPTAGTCPLWRTREKKYLSL